MREQGLSIYDVNGVDMVVASSAQEAVQWFNEAFGDENNPVLVPRQIPLDNQLEYMETDNSLTTRMVTYRQLIDEAIKDRLMLPCIIASVVTPPTSTSVH